MCGIYGYVGSNNAIKVVLNGLKMLQYRGYDSCGIAYFNHGKYTIKKQIGEVDKLKVKGFSSLAFGHTRWATNGKVCLANTHPHISYDNEYIVVHNGIIKNADILKHKLEQENIPFSSQTDTEVIVNYLSYLKGNMLDKLKNLYATLTGSFALIIADRIGNLYLLKKMCPLNLVNTDKGIYISSDKASLPSGKLYSLNDNDIIQIQQNNVNKLNGNITYIDYTNDIRQLSLHGYKHFMLKEILSTPTAIKDTYTNIKDIDLKHIFNNIKQITMLGCGTAYHSCLIGENLLNRIECFDIKVVLASNYECNKPIKKSHLHIIVSQSGETADCIRVAEQIKKQKGKILLITNEKLSTLTKYADYILPTNAGKEFAVASTKTYCSQCYIFAYMTATLKNTALPNINSIYKDLTNYIKQIDISSLTNQISQLQHLILIGKDIDYITLLEASLKIREIDYIYTLPMCTGELKHGTLSLVDNQSTIISLCSSKDKTSVKTACNEIVSRGGRVAEMDCTKLYDKHPYLIPIYSIIPFQLLSYNIAVKKGYNPDMPRNLAKSVTVE